MAAAEGCVAEFSSFANFEEKKRKSNILMSFQAFFPALLVIFRAALLEATRVKKL